MRRHSLALLAAVFASLAGCPQPPEGNGSPAATGQPGAAGPAPMGEPGGGPPPPAEGAPGQPGAVGEAGAPPPAGGQEGAEIGQPEPPKEPVGFASLIQGGKAVTIRGKFSGAKSAQIDFAAASTLNGEVSPDIIQIETSTDGKFSVQAPATFDRDIYIIAVSAAKAGQPSPDDPGGVYGPIKLEGKDVSVELTLSKDGEWKKKLPWFQSGDGGPAEPPPAPPAGGEAPPAAGGAPAAGAPAGDDAAPPAASNPKAPK